MRPFFFRLFGCALSLLSCVTATLSAEPRAPASAWISAMTTNGRTNPLGIGDEDLSFAWATEATRRGVRQSAYQIRLGTTAGAAELWDSGQIFSRQQIDLTLPPSLKLKPATRYYWQVRIWDEQGTATAWSPPSWFETGLAKTQWTEAKWIAHRETTPAGTETSAATPSLPLFRHAFRVSKPIKSARLYASAQGLYQFSLNGQRVGDQSLAPGWTDYPRRIQVQTYDVTSLLQRGANTLGAALGEGWFRGKVGLNWTRVYGDTLALIATLRVNYEDGSMEEFVTNEDWLSTEGPFVRADLQDGERYDARREHPGWDTVDFDASKWTPVKRVDGGPAALVPQPDEPIRVTEIVPARSRTEPAGGEYVYDFGQNLVGVARVKLTGRTGQTIRLRFAEEIYRKGERKGRLYTESLRTAQATDTYTFARDETVTYQPTFTQHGFRYVEITGADTPPAVADVSAIVLGSDLPHTGDLEVDHPMVNQLVRNIRWGQRGNFLSIPTDTPARDERLGWTGDIAVFAATAARYQDTRAFLSKWMDDLRDAQRENGNIPAIVPQPRDYFDETGVGWSDAFIVVPYSVWRATGDTRILRRNWNAMVHFYEFTRTSATRDRNLLEEGRMSWFSGDWLSLEDAPREAEHPVIATAYFAENTRMMAEMAAALGDAPRAKEYEELWPKIRAAFGAAYRQDDGTLKVGTQTVYAMALGMGLIAEPGERSKTTEKFIEKLAADHFHLKTGFLGTPWLLPALSRVGRDDLAMRLLLNEDYPSWGFEVRMGATTMWERWNTLRPDGEFGPVEMNSFNHYAYGAVGDWLFGRLGGIEIVEPGYQRFRIAPLVGHRHLKRAHGRLQTPYGLISCQWEQHGRDLTVAVNVPANTTAEILLPCQDIANVREGTEPISTATGVSAVRVSDGHVRIEVGSGRYAFSIRNACRDEAD